MDATAIATTPTAGKPAGTPESQARTSLSSDLNTFLRLLTAQIENQDPLEPADGTEYAAQLATFSNVEQAVRTNELLSDMITRLGRQDIAVAADWIGMQVRHDGPLSLQGKAITLTTDIPAAADRADLVVTTPDGVEVMRRPLDPTTRTLEWSGGDGRGTELPDGVYQVSVQAHAGSVSLGSRPVTHYATVTEVSLAPSGAQLVLPGDVRIDLSKMEALRRMS